MTELQITKTLQPGGVGMIATDELAHRVINTGKDPTGLGRWCWMQLQGRNGIKVRLISVYHPCDTPGATTTFQQQHRYLRKHNSDADPRQAIYDDLYIACSEWLRLGDQLIVGIDANKDIRTGHTAEFFATLGMHEAILTRHSERSPPATHNRNHSRQPIDGFFMTPGLHVTAAGYEAFGVGCPSDH